MPKCTINGKEIEVKAGTTIIEAMHKNAQKIAHYCYHPGLSIAGVCRLCMVEIEGNPRVQIACNTVVTEGMKINNTSEKVQDAVKWGLDFHLINHPLDCPICDQAGECGLQEQYMEFGKYDSEMAEKKQKKHKVVDLGPTVVLDSERCILCSRCVRFTDEISKTHELGLFNRGDKTEIGTVEGRQLDNKYSLNVVDICPVGALTAKDFRFRQRVWYLKDGESICTGCSTGCRVNLYFNKEGFYRVKPLENPEVNKFWMCDEGRNVYKFLNRDVRFLRAQHIHEAGDEWQEVSPGAIVKEIGDSLRGQKTGGSGAKKGKIEASEVAVVFTGQYSTEEYEDLVATFVKDLKIQNIFHWINNKEDFETFDGFLIRGDKNPNTKGLLKVFEKNGLTSTWNELVAGLKARKFKTVVVFGPENQEVYPDLKEKVALFSQVENLIWCQAGKSDALLGLKDLAKGSVSLIPLKTFVEKDGSFINHSNLEQKFKRITTVVSEALSGQDFAALIAGRSIGLNVIRKGTDISNSSRSRDLVGEKVTDHGILIESHREIDQVTIEHRKKNEFVFKRGPL